MAAALLALAGSVSPGITIDGAADAEYGAVLSLQNVNTSFGDSLLGQVDNANGSELDTGYGVVSGGTLYLLLGGNLENNFNKLEIFFDCIDGGQGQLRGDNPNVDGNGLNRMGYINAESNGLAFDTGFSADYWIGVTGGGSPYTFYANYSEILTSGGGTGYYLGCTSAGSDGTLSGGYNPNGIQAAIDNSNTNGVNGGTNTAWGFLFFGGSGAGVTRGVELAVPLSALGNPTGIVKVCAFINSTDHGYLSNQGLDGMLVSYCCPHPPPNLPSLGEARLANFNNLGTRQWFEVYVDCDPGWITWTNTAREARETRGTSTYTSVTLNLARTGGVCQQVTARYIFSNGTATVGADFLSFSGLVTFAQGQSNATTYFYVKGDTEPEPPETCTLHLHSPGGGALIGGRSNVTVTIRDDDNDGDDLSDDWEDFYFTTNTTQDASDDSDYDGLNNGAEECAGTNPDNSNSYWRTDFTTEPIDGAVHLAWSSAPARVYSLYRATSLTDGFSPLAQGLAANPPLNTYTDAVGAVTGYFYRVQVDSGCP